MRMNRNWLLTVLLLAGIYPTGSAQTAGYNGSPRLNGSFIQHSLVCRWSDDQWQRAFKTLTDAGMQYVVIGPVWETGKDGRTYAAYPTESAEATHRCGADMVEQCLRHAEKAGLKVFIGLNFHDKWWSANFTPDWLQDQMETGNRIAAELIARYKKRYPVTMYGWYWVWEVETSYCQTEAAQTALAGALNTNLDFLHAATPDMPLMLCPFFNQQVSTLSQATAAWKNIFKQTHFAAGDIFAPQDCIGAGGLTLPVLAAWFGAIKELVSSKPGMLYWSDVETFDQRFWTSATFDRLLEQMEIVKPFVSDYISFAYTHYYDPDQVNPAFHRAYLYYVRKGKLPRKPRPSVRINAAEVVMENDRTMIRWSVTGNKDRQLGGYLLYINDSLYANWQSRAARNGRQVEIKKGHPAGSTKISIVPYAVTGATGKAYTWTTIL